MDIGTSLIQSLREGSNICLSGGADGADLQWGLQAGKAGHFVVHWSFEGHRSQAPEQELVRLTPEQLELANDAVKRANIYVQRNWPSRDERTNNLLRRNWYQVKDAESLYAISEMDDKYKWTGGTAWAIQMYLDRFLYDEPMSKCKAYVFDKKLLRWYTYTGSNWELMLCRPPTPSGIWAGVGSREISALVRVEIRKVMNTYVFDDIQLGAIHPIIQEPKVGDIIYVPDRKIPGHGAKNRSGGWATVRRISTGDRTWISVGEFSDNDQFDWDSELKDIQIELRQLHRLNRAYPKPDFSPENNENA